MSSLGQALGSTVGRKYVMAVTGLIWAGFLATHLIANFLLLAPDGGAAFNLYAHKLAELGPLLWVAEGFLLVAMVVHIYNAAMVTLAKRAARSHRYAVSANAGGKSRKTLASISMVYTGAVIGIFLVVHIWMFKFGADYQTVVDGVAMRDLKKLVVETYENPAKAGAYMVVMAVLGLHLRHAIWSAFQSMGLSSPKWMGVVEKAGLAFAIAVSAGFFILPLAIFLGVGQ